MNAERGFTLLELIVTVVVASILLTVAVPSFTTLIRSNRAASEANALLTMLTLARSEAIKRNARRRPLPLHQRHGLCVRVRRLEQRRDGLCRSGW